MKTIRERLEELMPKSEQVWFPMGGCSGDFKDVVMLEQVLDALEKHCKVVYFPTPMKDEYIMATEDRDNADTHSALLIDIREIEPEDSLEKLVQDLSIVSNFTDIPKLQERAKRLTKKD